MLALLEDRQYAESWKEVVSSTLGNDGIYRSMLEHLRETISGLSRTGSQAATEMVMILDYFKKIQEDVRPEVVDAQQQLRKPS